MSRLQGASPTAGLMHDRFADLESVRAAWTETEARMHAFVAGLDDAGLERVVEYHLLNGQPGASRT